MTEPSTKSASTRVSRIIKVPREAVYQAFLDRDAVASTGDYDRPRAYLRTARGRRRSMRRSIRPKRARMPAMLTLWEAPS